MLRLDVVAAGRNAGVMGASKDDLIDLLVHAAKVAVQDGHCFDSTGFSARYF